MHCRNCTVKRSAFRSEACDQRQKILGERNVDFGDLDDLLSQPYVEDRRWRAPDQYRVIGFAGGRLTTFVVEYREDTIGELI